MASANRELERVSSALIGLVQSCIEMTSHAKPDAAMDVLALKCRDAQAEFELALAAYVGDGVSRKPEVTGDDWERPDDIPGETSVGDAPIVVPLTQARTVFETLYVLGAVALFGGDPTRASKALGIDAGAIAALAERQSRHHGGETSELWSTVSALAQAGLGRPPSG